MKVEWGRLARTAIATLALLTAAPSLPAQQASTLAASEAEELLGEWALSMDLQGRPVDMTLSLTDVDGHVAASLQGGRRPEPTIISEIAKTDAGLELRWQRDFGGQQATLAMKLALDGDGLTGTFGDDGGFFSAEVSGRRAGTVDAAGAAATAEGAQATADDGDSDGERSRRRSRRYGESVELVLAGHVDLVEGRCRAVTGELGELGLEALALVAEGELGPGLGELAGDRPAEAAGIGHAHHQGAFSGRVDVDHGEYLTYVAGSRKGRL